MLPSILCVGLPNCGKTTLFNTLTGSRYKTLNYPGATVDYSISQLCLDAGSQCHSVYLVDTPGIRSIIPRSEDEQVTRAALCQLDRMIPGAPSTPDIVLMVLDATQPLRHLALFRQLKAAGFRLVVVLSMIDLAENWTSNLDYLESKLECPVVGVDGRTGRGITFLKQKLAQELSVPAKATSLQLPDVIPMSVLNSYYQWAEQIVSHYNAPALDWDWDRVALHPLWGPLLFGGTMAVFFGSIFYLASPLMDWIDSGFSLLSVFLTAHLPIHWLSALLVDGVIGGIGSVAVFIPQIALLFFLLGLLESSGYLARGAAMVDRPLAAIGLNGKSFVPLLSGCACAIPAIMAARTIPGKKERWITMLVIPLMTCSARLPVYGLLIALLVGTRSALGGLLMVGVYTASLVLTSVTAAILGRVLRMETSDSGFQMELPRWRRPVVRHIVVWTLDQTVSFIQKAGPMIVGVSVALWGLSHFPSPQASWVHSISSSIAPILHPMGVDGRVGIALLLSFAAREVFVSALALVFATPSGHTNLLDSLQHATWMGTSHPLFTPPTIVSLLVFFMVSMQCMSTLAVARKEMGTWKWPILMAIGYIGLAYGLSVLCFQIFMRVG